MSGAGDEVVAVDDFEAQHVVFRDAVWFVADYKWDDDGQGGGHWHLTLTNGQPIKRVRRCKVGHSDRIVGCRYCAAEFVAAVAENLGVEPPESTKGLLNG